MGDRKLTVKLIGDSSQLERVFGRVGNAGSSMGSKVGTVFGGLAKGAAVFGAGATGALIGGKNLADAAGDLGEAQSKANVIFGDGDKIISKFGDNAAKQFGLSKRAATDFASKFGVLLKKSASGKELTDMSTALTGAAGDLSSFHNIASEDIAQKLFAGLNGQSEPLQELGVDLKAAAVEAKALELGLVGAGGKLSEGAKIQARYALIMEQTADAQGDFVRTSDGLANKQRILGAQWENMKAQLGEKLAPVFANFFGMVADKMPAVIDWLGPRLNAVIAKLGPIFAAVGEGVRSFIGVLKGGESSASGFSGFMEKMATFVRDKLIPAFHSAVAFIKRVWPDIVTTAGAVFKRVSDIISKFVKTGLAFWDRFGSTIIKQAKIAWDSIKTIIDTGTKIIGGILDTFTAIFEGDWSAAWNSIKGIFSDAWEGIKRLGGNAISALWDLIVSGLNGIAGGVGDRIDDIVGWFRGLPGRIIGALGNVDNLLFNVGIRLISGLWDGVASRVGEFFGYVNSIRDAIGGLFGLGGGDTVVPAIPVPSSTTRRRRLAPQPPPSFGGFGGGHPDARATYAPGVTIIATHVDPRELINAGRQGARLEGAGGTGVVGFR